MTSTAYWFGLGTLNSLLAIYWAIGQEFTHFCVAAILTATCVYLVCKKRSDLNDQ